MNKEDLKNGDFISIKQKDNTEYYIYYDKQLICLKSSASWDLNKLNKTDKENISYLGNYNCTQTFPDTTAQWHQFRQWFWKNYVGEVDINDEEKIISFIESLVLNEIPEGKKTDTPKL